MHDRTALKEKLEAKLEEWDAKIDLLKAKAHGELADTEYKEDDDLSLLEKKRREAEEKLEDIKDAGEEKWEKIKDSIQNFVNRL